MIFLLALVWLALWMGTMYVAVTFMSWWLFLIALILTVGLSQFKQYRLMSVPGALCAWMVSAVTMSLLSPSSPVATWWLWESLTNAGWGWLTAIIGTTVMSIICSIASLSFVATIGLIVVTVAPSD